MRIWSVHPLYLYHHYGAFHIYMSWVVSGAIPQRRQLLSSMVPIFCCQDRSSGWCPLRIRLMHVCCSLDSMLSYRNFKATAIPSSVSFKNEIANVPVCQCSLFSKYLTSIFKVSSGFVPNNSPPLLPLYTDFDIPQQTIGKICENLDVNKAKGPDEIPAIVYKRCSRAFSKSFNQIFTKQKTSVFPGSWKNSVVVPTYKKRLR